MSSGGFPLQMAGVGSLFDRMRLVVVRGAPRAGGVPLPPQARVVELPAPRGTNAARKLSVLLRSPRYGAILAREIARADVVHTPLPGDIPLLAFLIAAASGKRVIARYGSSWDTNSQTTLANRCTRGLLRVLAGGRRVVLATGGGAGEPAPRTHWIFATALTRAEIEATTPDLDRGLSDPPRLLTIGRLSSEKGVDVLLRAVARLAREGRTVRLTLAGDGPERASLEALARELDIADRVRFAGQLGREGLAREIARADLCVAPSRTEGFSKAWLDAFAGGLPVLATRVGAAEAAVGGPLVREGGDGEGGDGDDDLKGLARERGWLVRPDDAGALADALGAIVGVGGNGRAGLAPVDWRALRRRCREFVASRTLEAWADRIGRICADQWGMAFEGGKLLRPVRPLRAAANGGVRA